jgi:hypothetical protein
VPARRRFLPTSARQAPTSTLETADGMRCNRITERSDAAGARPKWAPLQQPDDSHYETVASSILAGWVTPFLGAGANLCEREDDKAPWRRDVEFPSGRELAEFLTEQPGLRYPTDAPKELLRVSQYFDAVLGDRRLYDSLHRLFIATHSPTKLHWLLAELPPLLAAQKARQQLVITTNYDDSLERAFDEKRVEYDLVWYEAKRVPERGKFYHRLPGGTPPYTLIDRPNEYEGFDLDRRPVILKLHGAIDRDDEKRDSYVITEDHYIEYLTQADLPAVLTERMADSHFLFLGYSLRDWNLRVILNRLWREQQLSLPSWSIQKDVDRIELKAWEDRGGEVELYEIALGEYVSHLRAELLAQAGLETPA